MGRPHSTRPQKGQSNKKPRIQVVTCIKMGLGHSNDDLRARNAAPHASGAANMSIPQEWGMLDRHREGQVSGS